MKKAKIYPTRHRTFVNLMNSVAKKLRTCPKLNENCVSRIWAYSEVSLGSRVDSIVHIHTLMGTIPTDMKKTKGYRRSMVLLIIRNTFRSGTVALIFRVELTTLW